MVIVKLRDIESTLVEGYERSMSQCFKCQQRPNLAERALLAVGSGGKPPVTPTLASWTNREHNPLVCLIYNPSRRGVPGGNSRRNADPSTDLRHVRVPRAPGADGQENEGNR